jgi:death-on-curing protein
VPRFLDLEHVLEIHRQQAEMYGGSHGCRDLGLLESALAMPRASFGGQYAHADLFEMAASYLFHLAKNHPFVDGNKRTAAMTAHVFLDVNGVDLRASGDSYERLVLQVAEGGATKADAAVFFRKHGRRSRPAKPRGRMEEE